MQGHGIAALATERIAVVSAYARICRCDDSLQAVKEAVRVGMVRVCELFFAFVAVRAVVDEDSL